MTGVKIVELKLDRINKSFGENHVLKDISFTAQSGKAFGLLGRNGSGKTTTIRVIMDIFPAESGTVTINGESNKKTKIKIGYLPEERGLYPKRLISDQMIYFGELRGMKASNAKASAIAMLERLEAGEYFYKKLETLSKGNQQKIQLAIAVMNNPDVVILDEPFSGLDPVNAILLKGLVEDIVKQGKMVIFSSHQMNYVEEFCDDICIINKGTIVLDGNLNQIKRSYPRNKLLITVADGLQAKLRDELESEPALKPYYSKVEQSGEDLVVTLKRPEYKQQFFSSVLLQKYEVECFKIVEPSLEQIFIEKAGDSNEAVS